MNNAHFERLMNCFEKVFPDLTREHIPHAAHDNVAEWDSVAQVTLLSVVAEEFGIEIDFEEFESGASFQSILESTRLRLSN